MMAGRTFAIAIRRSASNPCLQQNEKGSEIAWQQKGGREKGSHHKRAFQLNEKIYEKNADVVVVRRLDTDD